MYTIDSSFIQCLQGAGDHDFRYAALHHSTVKNIIREVTEKDKGAAMKRSVLEVSSICFGSARIDFTKILLSTGYYLPR